MVFLFKKNEISSEAALIVGVYENLQFTPTAKKIDAKLNGMLAKALKIDNFNGKLGDIYDFIALGSLPVKRLLCVGLGKKDEMTSLKAQEVGAYAANAVLTGGETKVAFAIDDLPAAPVGFGAKIATYRFTKHKTIFKKPVTVKEFHIMTETAQAAHLRFSSRHPNIENPYPQATEQ